MPITPCFDPTTGASGGAAGGGGAAAAVTPPSPTSESKAAGAALTNKTFAHGSDNHSHRLSKLVRQWTWGVQSQLVGR